MKRILLGAAGTATSWHLSKVINENFSKELELFLSDSNPSKLVASSIFTKNYFQVPLANHKDYEKVLSEILEKYKIDFYIPLIDHDVYLFHSDRKDLNTKLVSPNRKSGNILSNKLKTYEFLNNNEIRVPQCFTDQTQLDSRFDYFIKPLLGFGSRGTGIINSKTIQKSDFENNVIQEKLSGPEITIEVFNHSNGIKTICRERIETKAGVCTKARIFHDTILHDIAIKICNCIEMPIAFCFQVMKSKNNDWVLIDLNPRLGAGTSMVSKVGWSLSHALLATLLGEENPFDHLKDLDKETFVVRTYEDIILS